MFQEFSKVYGGLIWCFFAFPTKAVNICNSHTSAIPKVVLHLGVIGLHPLHYPPFVRVCFTLKHIFSLMGPCISHFVTNPMLGLQHHKCSGQLLVIYFLITYLLVVVTYLYQPLMGVHVDVTSLTIFHYVCPNNVLVFQLCYMMFNMFCKCLMFLGGEENSPLEFISFWVMI